MVNLLCAGVFKSAQLGGNEFTEGRCSEGLVACLLFPHMVGCDGAAGTHFQILLFPELRHCFLRHCPASLWSSIKVRAMAQ